MVGTVEAGAGKRKRTDNMADLEADLDAGGGQAAANAEAGTRLPGFVSAGVIQNAAPSAAAAAAASPAAGARHLCLLSRRWVLPFTSHIVNAKLWCEALFIHPLHRWAMDSPRSQSSRMMAISALAVGMRKMVCCSHDARFTDAAADPGAIDLANEGEDTALDVDAPASAADAEVVQAAVPAAVFGSVAAAAASAGV